MSDLKLFRTTGPKAIELEGKAVALEKSLQRLIEKNLDTMLGVQFLASEYSTGSKQPGRIDTLGLDENGCPVIIEYKRSMNENVINQGLFYLDWLMDHQAEFKLLVMDRLGKKEADSIEWSKPRLLCVAGDFTKYDEHAVKQMNRNIELVRYKRFGGELLLLELVNATSALPTGGGGRGGGSGNKYKPIGSIIDGLKGDMLDLYDTVDQHLQSLGDDVQKSVLKLYVAYKRIKNFACVEVHPSIGCVRVYVKVDPESVNLEEGFTRDVTSVGHFGTGDLEITLKKPDDLQRAQAWILQSYEAN